MKTFAYFMSWIDHNDKWDWKEIIADTIMLMVVSILIFIVYAIKTSL